MKRKYKYVIVSTGGWCWRTMTPKETAQGLDAPGTADAHVDLAVLLNDGWNPVRETEAGGYWLVLLCKEE